MLKLLGFILLFAAYFPVTAQKDNGKSVEKLEFKMKGNRNCAYSLFIPLSNAVNLIHLVKAVRWLLLKYSKLQF